MMMRTARQIALLLLTGLLTAPLLAAGWPVEPLRGAGAEPDWQRLPRFFSSSPAWDAFVNEYFRRHLSVEQKDAIYWPGSSPVPGCEPPFWTLEWDAWALPWIDRGAMGLARQSGRPEDLIRSPLLAVPIDKFGYVFGAIPTPDLPLASPGTTPYFWPWPDYRHNRTVQQPTGWEFNETTDGTAKAAAAQWQGQQAAIAAPRSDGWLGVEPAGASPAVISPAFSCESFQIPFVGLDVQYQAAAGDAAARLVDGLAVEWTTADAPEWGPERRVGVGFSVLPPSDYPADYRPLVSPGKARYVLYFPMYLHPKWGRDQRRITRLRVTLAAAEEARSARIALNYVRGTYDVRQANTNAILIGATGREFCWSGDGEFLRRQLPRLRKAMIFLNEHLQGASEGLLCFDWMVGKDGLGGPSSGHGMIGSYWDLLPAGRFDLESSLAYLDALRWMAIMEGAAQTCKMVVDEVSVLAPDGERRLAYHETAESLRVLAKKTKRAIERRLWNPETERFVRNIDVNGQMHDYGFLHHNLLALTLGVGTSKQRQAILEWLDGKRIVEGDTAVGADIYRWRFAPRTSTRRNESYYFWNWLGAGTDGVTGTPWGDQMQDGGAVPFTSLFGLMARCQTGRPEHVDRAYARTLEIMAWFNEVKAAGGQRGEFYRAYYNGHPERGRQQGGGPPGGLGLDREFLSDAFLGTEFVPLAFMGLQALGDGVLSIAPVLPSGLDRLGVENVCWHGQYLRIEQDRQGLSLSGSRLAKGDRDLRLRVLLPRGAKHNQVRWGDEAVRAYRDAAAPAGWAVELPLASATLRW